MYNILIADDHPLFREAICGVISSGFPQATLTEAEDLDQAMAILDPARSKHARHART